MRLAELLAKINPAGRGDLPKDVFIFCLILLVGIGAFLLGQMAAQERERKAALRLLEVETVRPSVNQSGGTEVDSAGTSETLNTTPVSSPQTGKGGGNEAEASSVSEVRGAYVASKYGEAYYLPWCGGVRLIKEENKIWFATKEEAEAKGYRPSANCKGL